jgi:8-amino-3,8-dideoxy-alpha-D-manno-octulosonate transaminase
MSVAIREKQKLALQGGLKAVGSIEGKGQPKIGVEEFMAIAERFGFSAGARKQIRAILKKENLGTGPFLANYYSGLKESRVQAFERVSREIFGVKYAIGVSSGTGALHAAFVAAGVGPGTEVIVPSLGFIATALAVVEARGIPVFCDIDESLSIDPAKIEQLVTPRTVALAPTHVMGSVCDMDPIMKIARKHKLKVVEDVAQACGARYKGRLAGTIGDLGCFSISAYKIVGGGEGGLILTNNQRLWERASVTGEGGGLWRPVRCAPPRYDGELFVGTNYRMSEIEAAVDVVQIQKMEAMVARFRRVKRAVVSRLKRYRQIIPQQLNDADGEVGYLLRFFPDTHELGKQIVAALTAEGIQCWTRGAGAAPDWHQSSHMFPVTLQRGATDVNCPFECPVYLQRGGKITTYKRGDCPVADDLFEREVSVSLNQWYSPRDCRNIADGINKVLDAYCTEDPKAKPWY